MKRFLSGLTLIVVASLQLLSCNAFNQASEKIEKIIDITPKTKLSVTNVNGNISVEIWNEPNVKVVIEKVSNFGRKELKKVDYSIEDSHETLSIKTVVAEPNAQVTVHYTIKVPTTIFVSDLQTTNGNLSVINTKGDLSIQTTNGSIVIDKVDGWLSASTVNGSVMATGGMGVTQILTTNGDIVADIFNIPQDGTMIRTSNAHIKLRLSNSIGLNLDLVTTNGSVKVNGFAAEILSSDETHYKAKIREGGKTLSAYTTNGNIDVTK